MSAETTSESRSALLTQTGSRTCPSRSNSRHLTPAHSNGEDTAPWSVPKCRMAGHPGATTLKTVTALASTKSFLCCVQRCCSPRPRISLPRASTSVLSPRSTALPLLLSNKNSLKLRGRCLEVNATESSFIGYLYHDLCRPLYAVEMCQWCRCWRVRR